LSTNYKVTIYLRSELKKSEVLAELDTYDNDNFSRVFAIIEEIGEYER